MDTYVELLRSLSQSSVRYLLIGVAGANLYASRENLFATEDRDFFLPLDASNLLRCWQCCRAAGWNLWAGDEPLGEPLDLACSEQQGTKVQISPYSSPMNGYR